MAGLEHTVRKPESNHCFEVFHRAFMMNLKLKNILSDQVKCNSCKNLLYISVESQNINTESNIALVPYPSKTQFYSKTELQRRLVTSLMLRVIR